MLNINNIPYNDKKTWNMLSSGKTKGVFQLESSLGSSWARKLRPSNIDELSALIALIRPGCLESGMTETYCNVKNKQIEPQTIGDKVIDNILSTTNYVLIYQEQILAIAQQVAWQHLPEIEKLVKADKLRKGVGKKDAKLLLSLREEFVSGCLLNNRPESLAHHLFDIIEKSARYSFNSAHAFKYAHHAYKSAYLKANYPLQFYSTYMSYSQFKMKPKVELRDFCNEAKMNGVIIKLPSIQGNNKQFKILNNNSIMYGLDHIKDLSTIDINNIIEHSDKFKNWTDVFVYGFSTDKLFKLRIPTIKALILSGALDIFGVSRTVLNNILNVLTELSNKEIKFVISELEQIQSVTEIKSILTRCKEQVSTKKRKDILDSEIKLLNTSLDDTNRFKAENETYYLGLSISCSPVDDKKIFTKTTCKDCLRLESVKNAQVSVSIIIDVVQKLITKKGKTPGQEMAIITCSDKSGQIRIACFPKIFNIFKELLETGNILEIELCSTGSGWSANQIYKI